MWPLSCPVGNDLVGTAQETGDRRGRRLELRVPEGGGHRDVQDRRPGSQRGFWPGANVCGQKLVSHHR
jgi:hypothetical protein